MSRGTYGERCSGNRFLSGLESGTSADPGPDGGWAISTNLFGTTYYSLVGLHAFHLTAGLVMLGIVLIFGLAGRIGQDQSTRVGVLGMYWHFVDAVWVVVFTVVYILGR